MPLFDYTASDREGALSQGQIEAADRLSASRQLSQNGLFVLDVSPASTAVLSPIAPVLATSNGAYPPELAEDDPLRARLEAEEIDSETTVAVATVAPRDKPLSRWGLNRWSRWSRTDRALYLRQLQVMFTAGIPLYRCAAALAEGERYARHTNQRLKEIPLDLERGRTLSKALMRSTLFSRLIVNSVRLGEESGQVDSILEALCDTEERVVAFNRALVSRLTYPAAVFLTMAIGLLVLGQVMSRTMTTLPAFQDSAPGVVTALASLYRNAAFFPLLVVLLALSLAVAYRLLQRADVRVILEIGLLRLPALGGLLKRVEATNICNHLALTHRAGLPLDQGVALCADSSHTLVFRLALGQTQLDLRNGEELSTSLKKSSLFPEDVLALIQVGEIAGSLSKSLDLAARYCTEQVELTLESVLSVLEPLLIALMGVAIGAVLLVTFVPIFDSLKNL